MPILGEAWGYFGTYWSKNGISKDYNKIKLILEFSHLQISREFNNLNDMRAIRGYLFYLYAKINVHNEWIRSLIIKIKNNLKPLQLHALGCLYIFKELIHTFGVR